MLSVRYELADDLDPTEAPVVVREGKGKLLIRISRALSPEEIVEALNAAIECVLAGGQWFQLWRGEIISMESPETDGGCIGRVRRGPLVDQAPGSRHR